MDRRDENNRDIRRENPGTERNDINRDRYEDFNEHRDSTNRRDDVTNLSNDSNKSDEHKDVRDASYKNRDENRRLHFLNDLSDYKVASDDPDVRGWKVVDVNNKPVGKIDNLLVDMSKKKVRYLDVDLDEDILHEHHEPYNESASAGVHEYKKNGDVHMIVPIGLAKINESDKKVISDEINRNTIEQGHLHNKGENISPDHERRVVGSLRGDNYAHPVRPTSEENTSRSSELDSSSERSADNPLNEGRSYSSDSSSDNYDLRNSDEREMRRPSSSDDTKLSRSSDHDNRAEQTERRSDDFAPEKATKAYRDSRDRNPQSRDRDLSDERLSRREERLSRRESTRGPIQDDFYENDYFDENRFYGRK